MSAPHSILDAWLIAFKSCENMRHVEFRLSREMWFYLAQGSRLPNEVAEKAARDGVVDVQVFEENYSDDDSHVCHFRIIETNALLIIAKE